MSVSEVIDDEKMVSDNKGGSTNQEHCSPETVVHFSEVIDQEKMVPLKKEQSPNSKHCSPQKKEVSGKSQVSVKI